MVVTPLCRAYVKALHSRASRARFFRSPDDNPALMFLYGVLENGVESSVGPI